MAKQPYVLTPGDRAIFEAAKEDPNVFLNFYLKSKSTGTYWAPGAKHARWKRGYDTLFAAWEKAGRPPDLLHGGVTYRVDPVHEKSNKHPDQPLFFHNHGVLTLPWAKELYFDRTPIRTIIGGVGSGKTMQLVMLNLVYAATLPGFRCFFLGPQHKQSTEMFRIAKKLIRGTPYYDRFVVKITEPPDGMIVIENDLVGQSTLEFYSINKDPEVLLSLTGDCAVLDQAEKVTDLQGVVHAIGSRFRGREISSGRGMLGTLTFIANSNDNIQLWDMFDMSDVDPENYKSMAPSSYDNIYLTDEDIRRFELITSDSPESRAQKLLGARPLGNGEHFSQQTLELMREANLDRIMDDGLNDEAQGYVLRRGHKTGTYEWLLPPVEGRTYLVVSDPGTKDPPHRDSPPIMIWDITDFPGTKENPKPATLAGFVWVYGNNNIKVWAARYAELVRLYKAYNTNAFDSTGFQAGYDEWISILHGLNPEPINLNGSRKWECLNAAKMLSTAGMIKMPGAVDSIYGQLSRYRYPEQRGDRQDVAVCFMMSCWWLQRLYFMQETEAAEVDEELWNRSRNTRFSAQRTRTASR